MNYYNNGTGQQRNWPIIELENYPDLTYIENVVKMVKKELDFAIKWARGKIFQIICRQSIL